MNLSHEFYWLFDCKMETLVYLAYLMQNGNHALEVVTRFNHKIPNKYVRKDEFEEK